MGAERMGAERMGAERMGAERMVRPGSKWGADICRGATDVRFGT